MSKPQYCQKIITIKALHKLCVMVLTCNARAQETEAGESRVLDQPELHSEALSQKKHSLSHHSVAQSTWCLLLQCEKVRINGQIPGWHGSYAEEYVSLTFPSLASLHILQILPCRILQPSVCFYPTLEATFISLEQLLLHVHLHLAEILGSPQQPWQPSWKAVMESLHLCSKPPPRAGGHGSSA
jgi:hypothetical protein